jgi:biopolymer transport protein ExbB
MNLPNLSLRHPALWRCARFCLLLLIVAAAAYLVLHPTVVFAQGAEEGAADKPEAGGNMLWWIIRVSGTIGIFIFLLSFYFVAVVIQQFLELRQSVAAPPEILAECENLIGQRNIQQLYDTLRGDDSYFSRALVAGVVELQHGIDEAREKLDRQADTMTVEMEKKITILAVLGTLGPMIGLLGTLKGMIAAFSIIAIAGAALKASEVAGAISESLVLTFEGVMLSVPSIYFYAVFRNRISTITSKTTLLADDQLRAIARLAKPRAGQAAS